MFFVCAVLRTRTCSCFDSVHEDVDSKVCGSCHSLERLQAWPRFASVFSWGSCSTGLMNDLRSEILSTHGYHNLSFTGTGRGCNKSSPPNNFFQNLRAFHIGHRGRGRTLSRTPNSQQPQPPPKRRCLPPAVAGRQTEAMAVADGEAAACPRRPDPAGPGPAGMAASFNAGRRRMQAQIEELTLKVGKLKRSQKRLRGCLKRRRRQSTRLRSRVRKLSSTVSTLKTGLLEEKRRRSYVLKPDAQRRRCTLTIAGLYRLGIKRNLGDGGCMSLIDTVEAQVCHVSARALTLTCFLVGCSFV